MSTLPRASGSTFRSISRSCYASTSRLPVPAPETRLYATETEKRTGGDFTGTSFGTTTARKAEGAVLKRLIGKGKPWLNSTRHTVLVQHPHLWKGQPFRDLTVAHRRKGGRDESGQIAVRHIGGGAKRRLRTVDFHRFHPGEHDVVRIEYDPGRSAHIALIRRREGRSGSGLTEVEVEEGARLAEEEGEAAMPAEAREMVKGGWSYILAPDGLRAGDVVRSYRQGIPKGLVEGWDDEPAELQLVAEASEVEINGDSSSVDELNTDPSSPQTVSHPTSPSPVSVSISPRSLGLMRTHTLKPGNVLPLYLIPPGQTIHSLSLSPIAKMRMCRSAGVSAQVVAHHNERGEALGGVDVLTMGGGLGRDGKPGKARGHVLVKMRSGEVRKFTPGAVATIGEVSNKEHQLRVLGKAGRARWLGRRPRVRGMAMNATDHPHGGGKGKSKGGKEATSIWGWTSKGRRTRRPKDKHGNKMVVTERPRGPHSRKGGY